MNCAEARRLLAQGVVPGSATPERAALGFHLAGCAACRAYRADLDQHLLANLLAAPEPPVPVTVITPAAMPAPAIVAPPAPPRRWFWYGSVGVLGALLLWVAFVIVLPIFHIHQNVQAMIIATSPPATAPPTSQPTAVATSTSAPTPTPAPTLLEASPTATHAPTATPLPTATATPAPTATPPPPPAGGPITVLLLGSDARPGEAGPSRTDAIIVARLDPRQKRIALLSLPRDLWVEVPGYGATRINAAHVWGDIYNDPEGGVGLARKTVSHLLGIPIDYTVLIDFSSFIGAIDSLGGITVDVPKELYDDQFPTMDYGYTIAHFLPGPQQMDGATALMYSRIRHPDSDFARMRRQQAVLVAMIERLREQNVVQDLHNLEAVTTALRDYVKTDLPEDRILGLGWALRDATPDHVEHYLLDENAISFGVGDDRWAEVADPAAIERLSRQLLGQ